MRHTALTRDAYCIDRRAQTQVELRHTGADNGLSNLQIIQAGFSIRLMGLSELDGARGTLEVYINTFDGGLTDSYRPQRVLQGSIKAFDGFLLAC